MYELNSFEELGVNLTKCGDLIVLSIIFIEIDQNKLEKLTKDLVFKALCYLQKRHPFFRSYLRFDEIKQSYYIDVKDDLKDKIKLDWEDWTNQEYDRVFLIEYLERFNQTLFDYKSEILWKVKLISYKEDDKIKFVLVLLLPIFITDGMNVTAISVELLNILNSLMENKTCDEMFSIIEPAQSILDLCKKYDLVKPNHLEYIENLKNSKPNKFLLDPFFKSDQENSGYKLNLLKLDKTITKKIIDKSKQYNIKLTSYLTSVAVHSLKKLYELNNFKFEQSILVNIAFNMRIRYKPILDFNKMNWQVGSFGCEYEPTQDLWKDAVLLNKLIAQNSNLNSDSFFSCTHFTDYYEKAKNAFRDSKSIKEACENLKDTKTTDLCISNIGKYVDQDSKLVDGPLEIKEMYYTDSLCSNPSFFPAIIFHISFWKDQLFIQLSSNTSCIDSHHVDQYFKLYEQEIYNSLN